MLRDDALAANTQGTKHDPCNLLAGKLEPGCPCIQTAMPLPFYDATAKYGGPSLIMNGVADVVLPDTPGGPLITDWLPVLCPRASGDLQFDVPDVGDQVLCLFLAYGLEQGLVIGLKYHGLYVLPEGDVIKVLQVAHGQNLVMLLTFYYTGARRGEVFRLKRDDINLIERKIRFTDHKGGRGKRRVR